MPIISPPGAPPANRVTLVENDLVVLWHYPDERIVHHQIRNFVSGRRYRDFLRAGADCFERGLAEAWLADDRACPVLRRADVEWSNTHWFPKVAANGWRYWAQVQPERALPATMLHELTARYAKFGVAARWFTDPEVALAWLRTSGSAHPR